MKESDLRKYLKEKDIPWSEFKQFMIGQTFTQHEGEWLYWIDDVRRFLSKKGSL